ncbi:MAG: hypothetical protein A2017_05465 [Lentisphaerae bacterium GWF2_44_16]|nr:MAG: hypothetical protein A2017_05465 [Lentisphaerae bacterium GWF2_44_16]
MNLYLNQAAELVARFFRFGGSLPAVLKLLSDDDLMAWWVESLNAKLDANPFEQTVEEQIAALRVQNVAGNWGISEDVFERLAQTAPAWPKGKDAYRSLRIRFGEGDDGVALTFERHAAAVKRVHAKFWRWDLLLSAKTPYNGEDVERLRLLNGNQSHHTVVEWIVIDDLSANRKRTDITLVRGSKSLADEGLVLGWLFPKRVEAIDYDKWSAWYCAGYELNVPENDEEPWQHVPCVYRDLRDGATDLDANWRSSDDSGYSVPLLRE